MKALIISDIHGSADRLQEALNTPHPYDMVILVGDLMYHGPRNPILEDYNPLKVSEILNAINKPILAVRGNCDSEVDQMLLKFQMMQDYSITTLNEKSVTITHGHIINPLEYTTMNTDLFISGHTHVTMMEMKGSTLLFNPGSISLPKEGHPCTYGYIDEFSLKTFTLDHKEYKIHTF